MNEQLFSCSTAFCSNIYLYNFTFSAMNSTLASVKKSLNQAALEKSPNKVVFVILTFSGISLSQLSPLPPTHSN